MEGYPDLEREDIQQAVEYTAWLTHEEVRPSRAGDRAFPPRRMRRRPRGGVATRERS
jgi:hypothetical protein